MSYPRWAATILAFPVGGWLAVLIAGPSHDPSSAALTGALAGAFIGALQWLALGRAASWRWVAATSAGLAVGAAASAAITENAVTVGALALTGLITGTLVGAGQGVAMRRGWRTGVLWALAVGAAWTTGWVVSAFVITFNARGYVVFGLSGALVVTIVTGLLLRRILGPARPLRAAADTTAPLPAGAGTL